MRARRVPRRKKRIKTESAEKERRSDSFSFRIAIVPRSKFLVHYYPPL